MSSTITLQATVNLASQHVELIPLIGVGGYSNEPALSLCNDVLQNLLSAPLDFKWNRAEMNSFVTSPNRQDYLFAGATIFSFTSGFSAGLDLKSNNALTISGSTVTIKTLEQYNGAVNDVCYILGTGSNYDSTLTQNGVSSTFGGNTYKITAINGLTLTATITGTASGISGSAGITDFGWLAAGTLVSIATNTAILPTRTLNAARDLQPYSTAGVPTEVAMISDNGAGVLKIRLRPVPSSQPWMVNLVYQKKAPLKTVLTQTWSPVPDEVSYVVRQGFLAACYRYANSPRADVEEQKFAAAVARAMGGEQREVSDIGLVPAVGLTTSDFWPFGF